MGAGLAVLAIAGGSWWLGASSGSKAYRPADVVVVRSEAPPPMYPAATLPSSSGRSSGYGSSGGYSTPTTEYGVWCSEINARVSDGAICDGIRLDRQQAERDADVAVRRAEKEAEEAVRRAVREAERRAESCASNSYAC